MVGLVVALAVVWGLVVVRTEVRSTASRTFEPETLIWFLTAYDVLFAGAMLGLFWLGYGWQPRSRLVGAIYLITGLMLLLALPTYVLRLGGTFPALSRLIRAALLQHDPVTGLPLAGAFIALTGLAALLPRRRAEVSPPQAESHPQG